MSAKGGITKGKSHAEGGIPMQVKSTGQMVELEGGEGVINKKNMADKKLHTFEGKEMTKCEIASEINSDGGNGVKIDCDDVTGKKYKHEEGGEISDNDSNKELREFYKKEYADDYEVKPLTKESEPSQEDFEKVWNRFKKKTAQQFGGTPRKRFGGSIDAEVEKMMNGGNVASDLVEHENRSKRRKKMQSFESGGVLRDGLHKKERVAFIFKVGGTYDAFDSKTYKDVGSYTFLPNQFYIMTFYMFDKENMEVYFEVNEGETIVVNRSDIRIEGFDMPKRISGDTLNDMMFEKNYQNLSEIDKEILEMLVKSSDKPMTTDQIEFISYFKGHNVVNSLTRDMMEQMYSYVFENKAGDMQIKDIFIYNNGCGNLLSYAPQYAQTFVLNNTYLSSNVNNISFATIEMQINDQLNGYKEKKSWEYIPNTSDMDYLVPNALLYVRKETNPNGFPEMAHFVQEDLDIKQISVCLSEFSSKNLLNDYIERQEYHFNNKFANMTRGIKSIVINKGITNKGKHSLFSILTKGF